MGAGLAGGGSCSLLNWRCARPAGACIIFCYWVVSKCGEAYSPFSEGVGETSPACEKGPTEEPDMPFSSFQSPHPTITTTDRSYASTLTPLSLRH